MKSCSCKELESIYGGTTITGTIINAVVNVVKLLADAGRGVGSAIRRISEHNMCPLE